MRKYYKYTSWTQPVLTSYGTFGGGNFAVNASSQIRVGTNPYRSYEAFDNNSSTYWRSGTTTGYIEFYNPTRLKVTNIQWVYFYSYPTGGDVQGSNDYENWTQLTTWTNSSEGDFNINLSTNTSGYKYYRINITGVNKEYIHCTQLNITATAGVLSTSSDYDYYEDEPEIDRKYYRYTTLNCTTTGTLTNNRGVVSGFSSAKYLKTIPTSIPYHTANSWEMVFKFKYVESSDKQNMYAQPVGYESKLFISDEGGLGLYINTTGNSTYVCQIYTDAVFVNNNIYYARAGFTGSQYYLEYSEDGTNWLGRVTYDSSTKLTNRGDWTIGVHLQSGYYYPVLGEIYLGESYIKINDKIYWQGANAEEIGTPADYDFYKDFPNYNLFSEINRHYYKYDTWTQPTLTENGTMGGDSFACNQSAYYTEKNEPNTGYQHLAYHVFDDDSASMSRWQVNSLSLSTYYYVEWYNPIALTITKLTILNNTGDYSVADYILYGSDDGTNWVTVVSGTNTNIDTKGTWDITVNNEIPYKYFRLSCKPRSTTSIQIRNIAIDAYTGITESTSSDYDFYKDKLDTKVFNLTKRHYYKYTSWTQPDLTSDTSYGTLTSSVTTWSDSPVWQLFDGVAGTSNKWGGDASSANVVWELPEKIKINSFKAYQTNETSVLSRFPQSITLYASNDGTNYVQVGSLSGYSQPESASYVTVNCNASQAYKYYKWDFGTSWVGNKIAVSEITITGQIGQESTSSDYDYYEDKNTYSLLEQQRPMSNVITYIPQDIKLVLANNTLTLKTGSKIYFPDGFEQDGTTPKFTSIITNKDVNIGATGGTGYVLICVNKTLSGNASSNVNNCVSGDNVTPVSYGMTYDTATNIITRYGSGTTHSVDNASFPLALIYQVNQVHTSIEQVFNGFGYIGNTIYSLPGIKSLIPNGRNVNRTIKTIEGETQKVHKTIVNDTWNRNNQPFFLTETATEFTGTSNDNYYPYKNASIQDIKTYATFYDRNNNLMYHSGSNAGEYDIVNYCFSGYFTITNGRISNLRVEPINN